MLHGSTGLGALFGVDVRFTVTDVEEASHSWAWTVHPPALTFHLVHTVERRPTVSQPRTTSSHGPVTGESRCGVFRGNGAALAIAARIVRR